MENKPSDVFSNTHNIEVLKVLQEQGKLQSLVEEFLRKNIRAVETFKIDKIAIVPGVSVYGGDEIHDYFAVKAVSSGEPKLAFMITDLSFKMGKANDNQLWVRYLKEILSKLPELKKIWEKEFLDEVDYRVKTYEQQLLGVAYTLEEIKEIHTLKDIKQIGKLNPRKK